MPKNIFTVPKKIEVRHTKNKHRGVFAIANIKKGEVIEISPAWVLPFKDKKLVDKTMVLDYYFYWGPKNQPAIALGYGSLYNHSYTPNAEYEQKVKQQLFIFRAIKDIKRGEEITTNYNGDWDSQDEVWFDVKK